MLEECVQNKAMMCWKTCCERFARLHSWRHWHHVHSILFLTWCDMHFHFGRQSFICVWVLVCLYVSRKLFIFVYLLECLQVCCTIRCYLYETKATQVTIQIHTNTIKSNSLKSGDFCHIFCFSLATFAM